MNEEKIKNNLAKLTILYVEDEEKIRKSLEKTLKMMFKNVISCEDGKIALEIFENEKIDIILSDINLPEISGIELSKIIRKKNSNIPIILLTAHTQTDILLEATKLKLVNYLVKPVDFEELFNSFKDALDDISKENEMQVQFINNTIYDLETKILTDEKNNEIHLTRMDRKFLDILLEYRNRTLETDEIKDMLWEDSYMVSDSAFKSILNKLRAKIGKKSIKNISGVGYLLVFK
jgi:DNA-binding response OmpR family regulator